MNLGTFNSIFDFSPNMDLSNCQVPHKFNQMHFGMNFWGVVRYSTGSSKCTHIRKPCIRV